MPFAEYADKYQTMKMMRKNEILEVTLHTKGGPLQWGTLVHREMAEAFTNIAADHEHKVVIITGTGEWFTGPAAMTGSGPPKVPAGRWVTDILWHHEELQMTLLNIQVPVICALNGPAWRHSELPLLCDIVLASDDTVFQDAAHLAGGMVPGDGGHLIYPLLMGTLRARYYLLTGQKIDAWEAKQMGLVNEVLPRVRLLPRAWELAEQLARTSLLVLRNTRALLTQPVKEYVIQRQAYGLALQGLPPADAYGQGPGTRG